MLAQVNATSFISYGSRWLSKSSRSKLSRHPSTPYISCHSNRHRHFYGSPMIHPLHPSHNHLQNSVIPLHRYFTSNSKPSSVSISDPIRPDIFYHLIEPPTPISSSIPAFALSLLPIAPASAGSSTIIGWLPAASEEGGQEAGLNDFKENRKFRDILHSAICAGLREGVDEVQINSAIQTHHGWMHIHDNRNIPALGRIGDSDDILASVLVKDGKILVDTYQPMPSYRLCTADGLMQLSSGLAQKLKSVLEARALAEQSRQSDS